MKGLQRHFPAFRISQDGRQVEIASRALGVGAMVYPTAIGAYLFAATLGAIGERPHLIWQLALFAITGIQLYFPAAGVVLADADHQQKSRFRYMRDGMTLQRGAGRVWAGAADGCVELDGCVFGMARFQGWVIADTPGGREANYVLAAAVGGTIVGIESYGSQNAAREAAAALNRFLGYEVPVYSVDILGPPGDGKWSVPQRFMMMFGGLAIFAPVEILFNVEAPAIRWILLLGLLGLNLLAIELYRRYSGEYERAIGLEMVEAVNAEIVLRQQAEASSAASAEDTAAARES